MINVKIKDIANELHLSVSTVSKALNGAFDISKETKEFVLAYAKKHGYKSKEERLTVKKKRRLCFLFIDINIYTSMNKQFRIFQNSDPFLKKSFRKPAGAGSAGEIRARLCHP